MRLSACPSVRLSALLAWLVMVVACQDKGVTPPVTQTAADSADQILFGLMHYVTEEGIKRSLVEADTAYLYDATQTAELGVADPELQRLLGSPLLHELRPEPAQPDRYVYRVACPPVGLDVTAPEQQLPGHVRELFERTLRRS